MILNAPSCCRSANQGSVLILVLWVIFFLALLAVSIGAYLEGRLALVRKIEQRTSGYYAARTGVQRSLALLQQDTNTWDALAEPWADSQKDFSNSVSGAGVYSVFYPRATANGGMVTNFGVGDEQGKIDLNLARMELLVSLFEEVGGMGPEQALKLADGLNRARTRPVENSPGIGEDPGWVNARIPRGPFKSIYEIRWVKGITDDLFSRVEGHVTVQGGYRVNLNTADELVLRTLIRRAGGGHSQVQGNLTRKILQFRDGGGIFKTYIGSGLVDALGPTARLTDEERGSLYAMAPFVTVVSDHFRGHAEGAPSGRVAEPRRIDFVWDRKQHRIEFWHED